MTQVLNLVPSDTDAEFAMKLKENLVKVYEPVHKLLDEATNRGFIVNVATGTDALGKSCINQLVVAKKF